MSAVPERLSGALADRYRIERELGVGGMATVYLAEDLKHKRKVALKVLKPELAAVLGAERFVQEITTTAALQHPHILPLFDSGTADGFLYYVMPFIDGETLRSKLDRETQLGIDEAVRIATDVASALHYAHTHGVIHRDIKPENILLHDGRPMVADFGIALAVSAAAGGRMTETGLSLGTPHYMSPEQATAEKEISARSDVYSLGSVLYEMLAGDPPHVGASAQQIIMKIVTEDAVPITRLRKSVPVNVAAAVAKAIEKLPADRFASAREFADALGNPSFHALEYTGVVARGGGTRVSRRAFAAVAGLAALLVIVALWGWLRPAPVPPVIRYSLVLPPSQAWLPSSQVPVPAPDGSYLVYNGPSDNGRQLWLKRRESSTATPLAGTIGAQSFTVSPDGGWVAFVVGSRLYKVPVSGGPAVLLASDSVASTFGLAWTADGSIVYPLRGAAGLMRVPAAGGAASMLWRSDSLLAMSPSALPDGLGLLFVTRPVDLTTTQLMVIGRSADSARVLEQGVTAGVFVAPDLLVYNNDAGEMFAARFDLDKLKLDGPPIPLGERLADDLGLAAFSISASGTLVTRNGNASTDDRFFQLVWVDREGRETAIDSSWEFQLTTDGNNHGWALSPDGSRLAIGLGTGVGDDIWVKPLPAGAPYRVTFDEVSDFRPRWTPDGRFITFISDRRTAGVYQRRADGTGSDSLLVAGVIDEALLSPDRQWLVLRQGAIGAMAGRRNITGLRLGVDSVPAPLIATDFDEMAIALSPDGKWLAYASDETGAGRTEIFVRPFPNTSLGKQQVSSGGGVAPLWSRDGRELYYLSNTNDMMASRVSPGDMIGLGAPVALFRVRDELLGAEANWYTPWDVARDGRFIMARLVSDATDQASAVGVVENWTQALKARVKR